MDKVLLLKKHLKDFFMLEKIDTGQYDVYGSPIIAEIETPFIGALLPLSKTDLQFLERGAIEFKDKKIYTKQDFKVTDRFKDSLEQFWEVVAELDYLYVADLKVYQIRRVN